MTVKKRFRPSVQALGMPSPWRAQHGGFVDAKTVDPDDNAPVIRRRALDLMGTLLANGTITEDMRTAGDMFHGYFRVAAISSVAISRTARSAQSSETMTERMMRARDDVASAIARLGGLDSPSGSCIWHVVGCETSIREWATRMGWSGRAVHPSQAQGILVGGLGMLVSHYGISDEPHRVASA